jgi:exosortase H (IPTLxxWG-CTERM-specific)
MTQAKPNRPSPAAPPAAAETGATSLGRFLVLFLLLNLAGFGLLQAPAVEGVVTRFSALLVTVGAGLIRSFGGQVVNDHTILRSVTNGFSVRMMNGCNGIHVTVLWAAAVLAFPAPWRRKASGLAAGIAVIQALNLVRFLALFYVGQSQSAWFDFLHVYAAESLMMFVTLALFWVWAQTVLRSASGLNAG